MKTCLRKSNKPQDIFKFTDQQLGVFKYFTCKYFYQPSIREKGANVNTR